MFWVILPNDKNFLFAGFKIMGIQYSGGNFAYLKRAVVKDSEGDIIQKLEKFAKIHKDDISKLIKYWMGGQE